MMHILYKQCLYIHNCTMDTIHGASILIRNIWSWSLIVMIAIPNKYWQLLRMIILFGFFVFFTQVMQFSLSQLGSMWNNSMSYIYLADKNDQPETKQFCMSGYLNSQSSVIMIHQWSHFAFISPVSLFIINQSAHHRCIHPFIIYWPV